MFELHLQKQIKLAPAMPLGSTADKGSEREAERGRAEAEPRRSVHGLRRASKRQSSVAVRRVEPPKLSAHEKAEVAQDRLNQDEAMVRVALNRTTEQLDILAAELSERLEELHAIAEGRTRLGRVLHHGSAQEHGGSPELATLMRIIKGSMKAQDDEAARLKLKVAATRSAKRQLDKKLDDKGLGGQQSVSYVDFQQLKIQRDKYVATLTAKNRQVLALKVRAGQAVSSQNALVSQCQAAEEKSARLHKEVRYLNSMIRRLEAEHRVCNEDLESSITQNKGLRKQIERHRTPSTLDYLREKAELQQLQMQVGTWNRRLNIIAGLATKLEGDFRRARDVAL